MPPRDGVIVVPHPHLLGRTVALRVQRLTAAGALLTVDADDASPNAAAILLPKNEVPPGVRLGDELTVFVTLDSEDCPRATLVVPKVQLGEVAFLAITAINNVGAFADWGLPKELLVPFREQVRDLQVGDRHPIGLFIDKTGRLAGTMRVSEWLRSKPGVAADTWVGGEAWRDDPAIGLFVVVERRFVGLVPKGEPHGLARGAAAMFRVTRVLPDGKCELSLRGKVHEVLEDDARHVLAVLALPTTPQVSDHSSPQEIRALFGLSKKAFKRATGRLLKNRAITIDHAGAVKLTSGRS